ncbi:MAG: PEP-CTERM sorting domain-containing protein [Lentisphaeria bacterium]
MTLIRSKKQIRRAGAAILLMAGVAQAAVVSVENSSFESPNLAADSTFSVQPYDDGNVVAESGWDFRGGYRDLFDNRTAHAAYGDGGSQYMTLFYQDAQVNVNPGLAIGRFTQTLATDFAANTTYTLKVQVARNTSWNYAGYEVGLASGAAYWAGITDNDYSLGGTWDAVKTTGAKATVDGAWTLVTLNYTTPASGGPVGSPIVLVFAGGLLGNTAGDENYVVLYDAVSLEASSVPEPATLGLLALGGLVLLRRRR